MDWLQPFIEADWPKPFIEADWPKSFIEADWPQPFIEADNFPFSSQMLSSSECLKTEAEAYYRWVSRDYVDVLLLQEDGINSYWGRDINNLMAQTGRA